VAVAFAEERLVVTGARGEIGFLFLSRGEIAMEKCGIDRPIRSAENGDEYESNG
jgi:hypothetical protein